MAMPIVTVHRGYAPYLVNALAQAKFTNPQSEIVLIGDSSNQFLDFVRHEDLFNYYSAAQQFEQVYADKHRSPNSYPYELFCFQRWFILQDFMQTHQIEQCVHIDSDVMLYANLTEEWQKFERFELTLINRGSPHTSFIKYQGIVKFCQFLTDTYTVPSLFAELEQAQLSRQLERPHLSLIQLGGISDMSLFRRFYQLNADLVGSTSDIIEDSVYDFKIDAAMGFSMRQGLKHIQWIDRQPYCRHLERDRLIKFNSLHFQGATKRYIHRYFTGNQWQALYYKVRGFLSQIRIKFLNGVEKSWSRAF
jgi:hypothetical protein